MARMAVASPLEGRVAQAQMRAANMGLILRHLRAQGGRSRARLSEETGLSKATTSTLVADLAERGLVAEGDVIRGGAVGRPGQIVSLDGAHVIGVGVQLGVDHGSYTALSLDGTVVREDVTPLDVEGLGIDGVLDLAAAQLRALVADLAAQGAGVVGITVSPPGVIDYAHGVLRFAPNLGWRGVPLVEQLTRRLGEDAPPIQLENDAKLAALAEYEQYEAQGIRDMIFVTGEVGVGAGIISDGHLVRGWSGFSGEVGHLPLAPEPTPCNCGRRGCWETVVGLSALLRLAAPEGDPVRDPSRPIEERLAELRSRADADDAATCAALETLTGHLAHGLALLVDVLNPRVIVLGGWFAFFGDHLLVPLGEALEQRRMDEGSGVLLATSTLGLRSAARGGALLALEHVFHDPTVVQPRC